MRWTPVPEQSSDSLVSAARQEPSSRRSGSAPGSSGASSAPRSSRRRCVPATRMSTRRRATPTRSSSATGLAASGVPRERVFITTKVRPDRMADGDLQRSVDESLAKLRRRPRSTCCCSTGRTRRSRSQDTIRALNAVKRDGRARHIGLSNFTQPAARRGLAPDQGAVRGRADRVPPLSRPDEDARGAASPRHGDHRLLPDRARQGRRRSGHRGDRQGTWPQRRAGDAALAHPAARRRRHPEDGARSSGWRRTSTSSTSR